MEIYMLVLIICIVVFLLVDSWFYDNKGKHFLAWVFEDLEHKRVQHKQAPTDHMLNVIINKPTGQSRTAPNKNKGEHNE